MILKEQQEAYEQTQNKAVSLEQKEKRVSKRSAPNSFKLSSSPNIPGYVGIKTN